MGKDKHSSEKESASDNNKKKFFKIEHNKGPVYTGAGFVPVEQLVDGVKAWQQRQYLCEEVDYLQKQGGRNQ